MRFVLLLAAVIAGALLIQQPLHAGSTVVNKATHTCTVHMTHVQSPPILSLPQDELQQWPLPYYTLRYHRQGFYHFQSPHKNP